jgi:hypothetical protein
VGRTLLSALFEVDLVSGITGKSKGKVKGKVKGSGQECPLHIIASQHSQRVLLPENS